MKTKKLLILYLTAFVWMSASCYRRYGFRFYPDAPRFSPTDPAWIALLRNEPRREHIRLGEV